MSAPDKPLHEHLLDLRIREAAAELSRMRTALEELFKLVEDGVLVRDISHDDKPGWTMGAMRLVRVLKQAQDAIAERALTAGSDK